MITPSDAAFDMFLQQRYTDIRSVGSVGRVGSRSFPLSMEDRPLAAPLVCRLFSGRRFRIAVPVGRGGEGGDREWGSERGGDGGGADSSALEWRAVLEAAGATLEARGGEGAHGKKGQKMGKKPGKKTGKKTGKRARDFDVEAASGDVLWATTELLKQRVPLPRPFTHAGRAESA